MVRSSGRAWTARLTILAILLVPALSFAQSAPSKSPTAPQSPGKGYLLPSETGLEMMVHVIGEVQKPGEYRVPDHTDVLELIAKAGGPTEYANLSWVKIRRVMPVQLSANRNVTRLTPTTAVLDVNVENAWKKKGADSQPPRLVPGDVVVVSRNSWFGYKRFATVLRDAALVASAYFLYLRVAED
ncbi:MAG TPA: SLBB domain-containing protein [Candidatus Eisenbacteria bacterium]|nr:SLBB domain-containing protein [Candidatus Eisenbacteria bacterium]